MTFQCLDLLIYTLKIIILINITWVIVRVRRVNAYKVQRLVTVDIIPVVICLSHRILLRGQVTVLLIGVFIMKPKKQLRAESSNCPMRKRNL